MTAFITPGRDDVRACECGTAVIPNGQNWIHADGSFRCPPGGPVSETGWALPFDIDELEARVDAADAEGYERGREDAEYDLQDRIDEAQREAREEALADVIRAVERL